MPLKVELCMLYMHCLLTLSVLACRVDDLLRPVELVTGTRSYFSQRCLITEVNGASHSVFFDHCPLTIRLL